MRTQKQAALLWSGGKDSALALHHARQSHADIHITRLVTCVSRAYDRVSMHGVRRQLIEEQANALGLRVDFIVIPDHGNAPCPMKHTGPGTTFPPNDVYSKAMLAAFARLKEEGIEVIVFGDIFLEDLRAYRENLLATVGLEGRYPLWGRDTTDLYAEFLTLGFEAVVVCVDTERLTEAHCGQLLTRDFLATLPKGADPCGERGEYHTFTFAGPLFQRPVAYALDGIHRQSPFAFRELTWASTTTSP